MYTISIKKMRNRKKKFLYNTTGTKKIAKRNQ